MSYRRTRLRQIHCLESLERRELLAASPISFGGKTKATYTDADGGIVVVSLKGPGAGTIQFTADAPADAAIITLEGTTAASALSVKGDTRFGGLLVNGSLKSISGKTLDLTGTVTLAGSAPKAQIRNIFNSTMTIGPGAPVSLTLGSATDVSLTVQGDVKSLKLGTWADNDATPDAITANNVASLTTKGNFAANLTAGTIGKINIGGFITDSQIRGTANIGTITAAALKSSLVYAGIRLDLSTLPTSVADFANGVAAIKSLTLKGKLPGTFGASNVAAPSIGKLSLGPIGTFAGFTTFGVAADRIDAFSGSTNLRGQFQLPFQEPPTTAVSEDDFVVRVF